ncbi:ribonuclease H-like domain-containing protein [Tanacetum coccineum]
MDLETAQTNTTAKLPILKQENGNSFKPVTQTTTNAEGPSTTLVPGPITANEKIQKNNDVKARSMLLMLLPNKHLLTFNQYKDAKTLFAAIQTRFGGNEATKKTKKTLLNQIQLAILGENISQEDLNLKFLRSLPSDWNTHVVVWWNKSNLDTMSFDDLYNNSKIVEQKVKGTTNSRSSSSSQNMAFVSSPSSTNEDSTAYRVSTDNTQVNPASTQVSTASTQVSNANLSDTIVYSFLASQPNGSHLVHEDLKQIHEDDLEEMDLKWQLALLSMRTKRFFQKTGRNITINGSDITGYDKFKVECFNCHKLGHFARECRGARNQDSRNSRRTINVEETSSKAMLAIDGAGFDWSYMADDEVPTNMALMAFSDSEVHNDKTCSKPCLKSFETLKTQLDDLRIEFNKSEFNLAIYKRGLASIEEQLVFYKKNEVIFYEQIVVLKRDISYKDSKISVLKSELEKLKQEKESNQLKIENFDNASKSLDKLIGSQIPDKSRKGLGFPEFEGYGPKTSKSVSEDISNEVMKSPDAPIGHKANCNYHQRERVVSGSNYTRVNYNYSAKKTHPNAHRNMTPRAVLMKTGIRPLNTARLVNTAHPKTTVYSARPMESPDASLVEELVSNDKLEKKTVFPTVPKINFVRPQQQEKLVRKLVNYAEMYRSQNPRRNQRNWNNQKSQQLGSDFMMYNKACFGHPQKEDQGYVDSGCSRHMIGNMSYLSDFKEFDGGYVTFGEEPKEEEFLVKELLKQLLMLAMMNHNLLMMGGKKDDEGVIDDQERTENSAQDVNNVGPSINTVSINFNTGSLNINTISPTVPTAPLKSTYADFFGRAQEGNPSIKISKLDRSYARRASAIQITTSLDIDKARLVVQGYTQEEGIDYDDVFALVARIEAIMLFLAYASFKDFVVYQMDVKSAFLYGKIEKEVYVCQPSEFEDLELTDKVYKVEKALYGLHQAPRAWYETLSTYLLDNGFQRGQIDNTLFIKRIKSDILLKFQMSSMSELTFFLGLQVTQKDDGIFISQDKYVDKILKKFGFLTVKTASTHMETLKPLMKDENAKDVDVHLYRSMIGSLMYLTSLRLDIMFTDSPFDLEAYTDSDYAGASLDRKSTTRGCQFLRSRLISWKCKKQTIVANSTTEAEYVAATSCCGQVPWIQNQILDYGYNFMNTKIFIDNESTICIVKNPVFHSKTKHIKIRYHFIRDSNEKKLIQMIKIHTDLNIAYLLTKAFDVGRFQYLIANRENCQQKEIRDDVSSKIERELVRIKIDDGNAFWNEIEVYAGISKINAARQTVSTAGHYLVLLGKKNDDFDEIVDFLNASSIRYALTVSPTIYKSYIEQFWSTSKAKTVNNERQMHAKVVGKTVVITESSVRRDLQFNDEDEVFNDDYVAPSHTKKVFAYIRREGKGFLGTITPLFPSMLVTQAVEGEGSGQPSEPQHTPTTASLSNIEPIPNVSSSSQPPKTHKSRKAKRPTEISQSSGPTTFVADETVHEERGDSVERATTIATSLDAAHDSDTILGDIPAQTRFERLSKQSHDPPLSRVNTLRSGEDRMQLQKLMELCTKLSDRVLDMEKIKDAQALDIQKLKIREDAETHIEVTTASAPVTTAGVSVSTAEPSTPPITTTIIKDGDLIIAQTLMKMRSQLQAELEEEEEEERMARQREEEANLISWDDTQVMMEAYFELAQRLQVEEQGEITIKERSKLFVELMNKKKHFAKLRAEEIRRKPPTKAQKRNQMSTYLKNMAGYKHMEESKSQAEGSKKRKRAELDEETVKRQKLKDDAEKADLKACLEIVPRDDEAVNVESLATKYPIVDWKTHILAEDKMYYEIIRADRSTKYYKIFTAMLDDFDRKDVLDLYKLVKERFETTSPEGYDRLL